MSHRQKVRVNDPNPNPTSKQEEYIKQSLLFKNAFVPSAPFPPINNNVPNFNLFSNPPNFLETKPPPVFSIPSSSITSNPSNPFQSNTNTSLLGMPNNNNNIVPFNNSNPEPKKQIPYQLKEEIIPTKEQMIQLINQGFSNNKIIPQFSKSKAFKSLIEAKNKIVKDQTARVANEVQKLKYQIQHKKDQIEKYKIALNQKTQSVMNKINSLELKKFELNQVQNKFQQNFIVQNNDEFEFDVKQFKNMYSKKLQLRKIIEMATNDINKIKQQNQSLKKTKKLISEAQRINDKKRIAELKQKDRQISEEVKQHLYTYREIRKRQKASANRLQQQVKENAPMKIQIVSKPKPRNNLALKGIILSIVLTVIAYLILNST